MRRTDSSLGFAGAAVGVLLAFSHPYPAYGADDNRTKQCAKAHSAGDWTTALTVCRPLAEQGNAVAQVVLGFMFANSQGVLRDDVAAAKWFRLSAEQGNPLGQTMLGSMYGAGDGGLPRDPVEAARLYTLAANQGLPNAQFYLARAHLRGLGVTRDLALSASWLRRAAEQDFPQAQIYLAFAYRDGLGVEQDNFLYYFWLTVAKRHMTAAERNEAEHVLKEVARRLTPQKQREAIDLADKWRPKLESPAPRQ